MALRRRAAQTADSRSAHSPRLQSQGARVDERRPWRERRPTGTPRAAATAPWVTGAVDDGRRRERRATSATPAIDEGARTGRGVEREERVQGGAGNGGAGASRPSGQAMRRDEAVGDGERSVLRVPDCLPPGGQGPGCCRGRHGRRRFMRNCGEGRARLDSLRSVNTLVNTLPCGATQREGSLGRPQSLRATGGVREPHARCDADSFGCPHQLLARAGSFVGRALARVHSPGSAKRSGAAKPAHPPG